MAVKSYALTTVARAEDFLGTGTLTGTNANVLERIIDSVTEFVENYCKRRFKQTAYTNELYDGTGSDTIILQNYPVSSTESFTLQIRTSSGNENEWESVDSEDYFINFSAGIVRAAHGLKFLTGTYRYRVSYTAGYGFDNSSTFLAQTEAGDVEYVTWKLIAAAWNRRKSEPGIKSESIGDYSVTYMTEAFENEEIKAVLDKYARIESGSYQTPKAY